MRVILRVTLWPVGVAAFGSQIPFLELFAMYLAATALAAASPTPGNLGALELALGGGLASLGMSAATAFAAVLVFRLLTFWLPLLPGFLAFRYLQHGGHL